MTPRSTRFDDPATLALLENHRDCLTAAIASLPTQDFAVENARQWLERVERRLACETPLCAGFTGSDLGMWGPNGRGPSIDSAVKSIEFLRERDAAAMPERKVA